jgi:hypothetical protein
MSKPEPINPKILFGAGNCSLECGNMEGVAAIELFYKGNISITSTMAIQITWGQWNIIYNNNRIRILGLTLTQTIPELLFNYQGLFKPTKATVYSWGLNSYTAQITPKGIDLWELDKTKWEDDTVKWEDSNVGYKFGNPIYQEWKAENRTRIAKRNKNKIIRIR